MYRVMPWLKRFPGARVLYGDRAQAIVLSVGGVMFLVIGLMMVFGVVDLR